MSLLRSLAGKLRSSVLLQDYLKSKHLAPLPPLTTSHRQINFYYYYCCSTPAMISSHGSKDDQCPREPQGLGSVGQKKYETHNDDHAARRLAQFTINKHNAEEVFADYCCSTPPMISSHGSKDACDDQFPQGLQWLCSVGQMNYETRGDHARRLAQFAIYKHNAKENEQLQFVRVVKVRRVRVAGIMYFIKLEAIVDSEPVFYLAVLWERTWLNSLIVEVWKRVDADFSIDDYVFDGKRRF